MAANKTLDPTTCTTASEAFKYPLPQVRQFHRSLTAELDEKNARLRTLVGGSYRQLLGTAEMILHMRDDINVVEDKLGRVGKGCGRGAVSGMAGGLGKLQERATGGKHGEELQWSARMKVLGMCAIVVGRLLKKTLPTDAKGGRGRSLVLAAKVLVLSRLLEKSVGDMASMRSADDKEQVEDVRRKLGAARKRLRRAIERTLEIIGDDNREDLVQALSAYSLATSSGAKDVLRRFLDIRGGALALAFEDDSEQKDSPGYVRALELYTRTLLDVQALVPRRLSEALAGLKTKHLLKDESLRELEGLRLDVCEKWFGDEILFFTPYIRHDDLEGSHAVSMLKAWAKQASEIMLQELTRALDQITEFKTVVELRTRVLEIWIREGGKARGFDPSILLDGLRKVVNDRLVQLLESRVSKLHLVATEVEGTLGSWRDGITDRTESLWDDSMAEMDIQNGASLFKQSILARTHGRNDAVSRAYRGYQTWRHLVNEITAVIEQLKKQRWDDDLEDIEDDLTLESRSTLLSTEDPEMLQGHLDTSLGKAYKELHNKLSTLLDSFSESEHLGPISIYFLRIIRDIRCDLPKNASAQSFGLSLVPNLHTQLVVIAAKDPLSRFTKTFKRKKVAGRALWEGSDGLPALPVQPSPGTYKFLHGLALSTAKTGFDLWSPKAVSVLKRHLNHEIGCQWIFAHEQQENEKEAQIKADGTVPKDATELEEEKSVEANVEQEEAATKDESKQASDSKEPRQDVDEEANNIEVLIQALFDTLVLQHALETSDSSSEDELATLRRTIESRLQFEAASKKRLEQSAKEYWKKTSLLLGLLA
jgi:hypothetical protein